jgi:hypothetical protein
MDGNPECGEAGEIASGVFEVRNKPLSDGIWDFNEDDGYRLVHPQ